MSGGRWRNTDHSPVLGSHTHCSAASITPPPAPAGRPPSQWPTFPSQSASAPPATAPSAAAATSTTTTPTADHHQRCPTDSRKPRLLGPASNTSATRLHHQCHHHHHRHRQQSHPVPDPNLRRCRRRCSSDLHFFSSLSLCLETRALRAASGPDRSASGPRPAAGRLSQTATTTTAVLSVRVRGTRWWRWRARGRLRRRRG